MGSQTVYPATCPSCGGTWLLYDGLDDPTVIDFGVAWPRCVLCCRELDLGLYITICFPPATSVMTSAPVFGQD